ncbi:uncharacterized protein J3D65DRAFT_637318 [Phyllosticta citribraziliensis]|uniref:Uncharacterized protein n=1 Tax=Phyllosticta citribraziliensis TaxID=989973 RepID=A0ABR1L7X2_9PEZI
MLSYNGMQGDARFGYKHRVESSALISKAELRAWFEVSVCLQAKKPSAKLDGLVKATKELGLNWKQDVSWRLRRLILLFDEKGKFPAQGFRGVNRRKEQVTRQCIEVLRIDLCDLLKFVQALRPEGGDHAAEPWGDVKTRILTNIHRCIRSREKGIEIPFDLLVFIKAQAMWYYSEVGVDFERKAKTLKFVGFDQSLNQTVRSRRRASRRPLLDHNEAPMQLQGLDQRRQRVWREEISAAKRASSWVPQTSPTPQQQADGESHISSKKPFIQWGSINPPPRAHQGRRCSG